MFRDNTKYKYTFSADVDLADVEDLITLAVLSAAAVHGESQAYLDARYSIDPDRRRCTIDASTVVGREINQLFVAYAVEEFGAEAVSIQRLESAGESAGVST